MPRLSKKQIEIAYAQRSIAEQYALIDEIRANEGNREANACMLGSDCVRRMQQSLKILDTYGLEWPLRIIQDLGYTRACGWHNRRDGAET